MERQQVTKIDQVDHYRKTKHSKSALPTRASDHSLLQLQQRIGNQAVGWLIQAKLKVGQPGDKYEQEDGQVVGMDHLIWATKRELQKMGKAVVEGKFGEYAVLAERR